VDGKRLFGDSDSPAFRPVESRPVGNDDVVIPRYEPSTLVKLLYSVEASLSLLL